MFISPVVSAQPFNDNFASRALIAVNNGIIFGSLSNATFETGEPFIEGISSGQTAWWTWTAPSNGIVTLSVIGTNFSPLLTVYVGSALGNLSLLASNNFLACYEHAECGCHWRERSQVTFHVARGQAYQIAADSAIITDAGFTFSRISHQLSFITNFVNTPVQPVNPITTGSANGPLSAVWSVAQTTNVVPGGDLQVEFQFTPAPANDNLENAVKLAGSRTHVLASNAGAGKQSAEPDHLGNPGGSSVWYSWKAPKTGRVTLSTNNIPPYLPPDGSYGFSDWGFPLPYEGPPTCGNEVDQNPPPVFYPVFAAYTGTNLASLALAGNCLPMNLAAYPNAVEFDVVKGRTYQIAFDGNGGTTGQIPLYLSLTTPASNDHFKNRIQLHGINITATGFNAGATLERNEPAIAGSVGKSVWWSWTAPLSGPVAIAAGGDYQFPFGVFIGTSLSNLVSQPTFKIPTDDPDVSGGGPLYFQAVQGRNYKIAVADSAGLTGAIYLWLQAPVIELPLIHSSTNAASFDLLTYSASPRQVVLLQSSPDGSTWKNVRTALARQSAVNFIARPKPAADGPFYRAIVVDYR